MKKIIALLFLFLAESAHSAMTLDKIIVYLDDTPNAREDIVITNPDAETLYLQTEVFRVDNPGQENEQRVRVVDPEDFKLLVSPAKAVLASGDRKRFRLMSLEGKLDKEKVYRVTFRPVVGEVKSDRSALKILVAYQALVFIQPKDGAYKLGVSRRGDAMLLENSGNINVEVVEIQHCIAEDNCQKLEDSGRLYAGGSMEIEPAPTSGELVVLARGREGARIRLPLD